MLLGGVYHIINSDDAKPIDIPEWTEVLTSQTATVSDTYVTIGDPTWTSAGHPIGRLRSKPITHPSTLSSGQRLELLVLFEGEPMRHLAVLLTREGQRTRGDEGLEFVTDRRGHVSIPLNHIGTHLLMTRMQAPAPEGASTDIRSYTTSLTFNVP